jgi:hypothetical protein
MNQSDVVDCERKVTEQDKKTTSVTENKEEGITADKAPWRSGEPPTRRNSQ